MIDKAIAKITNEAMAIDDPLAFAIEECLTAKCTSVSIAQKILADDKKLQEIHDNLIEKAKTKAKPLKSNAVRGKGVYFDITPDILEYYGIGASSSAAPASGSGDRVDILDLI